MLACTPRALNEGSSLCSLLGADESRRKRRGWTPGLDHQVSLCLQLDALKRADHEHRALGHAVWLGQFGDGQKVSAARGAGMRTTAVMVGAGRRPEKATTRGQYARQTGEDARHVSWWKFLAYNSRCGRV